MKFIVGKKLKIELIDENYINIKNQFNLAIMRLFF